MFVMHVTLLIFLYLYPGQVKKSGMVFHHIPFGYFVQVFLKKKRYIIRSYSIARSYLPQLGDSLHQSDYPNRTIQRH